MRIGKICLFIAMGLMAACGQNGQQHGERALPVEIGEATVSTVPVFIESIGNVFSLQTVEVTPQVGGVIEKVHVSQGQDVRKGQVLYTIDARPYRAQLDKAKATLTKDQAALQLAELTVNRFETLVKEDYVSKLTYDQYKTEVEKGKAQVEIDKAEVALAEINLGYTTIRAPMDGRISQYNVDVGNVVEANDATALTQILKVSPADIHFAITQREFVEVRRAQLEGSFKFEAYLPEFPAEPREGKIYFFDNHIDTETGTILFKGTIPNDDYFFWPGEFVKVRLQLKLLENAVLVPESAIQIGQEGKFVYILKEDSTVEYRKVETGQTYGDQVMIASGVKGQEKVVTNGQINLRPGAKVSIVDDKKTSPEKEAA